MSWLIGRRKQGMVLTHIGTLWLQKANHDSKHTMERCRRLSTKLVVLLTANILSKIPTLGATITVLGRKTIPLEVSASGES